ncbi:MAG: translation initiation factor IF-6 [Candidatus Micrarchaeia archaeon]
MIKLNFYGNPYIGVYAKASDRVALIPQDALDKFEDSIRQRLKVEVYRATIASSGILGIYTAMNSNGIVVPNLAYKDEVHALRKETGMNVCQLDTKSNAIGNVICCNDKGAIVSDLLEKSNIKKIEDCLGVEAVQLRIAGFATVGVACIATNKGLVAHNNISDDELKQIEEVLGVDGINSSVNMGFPFPAYGIVANSNGYVVGEKTSGIELMRIERGLGFTKK